MKVYARNWLHREDDIYESMVCTIQVHFVSSLSFRSFLDFHCRTAATPLERSDICRYNHIGTEYTKYIDLFYPFSNF